MVAASDHERQKVLQNGSSIMEQWQYGKTSKSLSEVYLIAYDLWVMDYNVE